MGKPARERSLDEKEARCIVRNIRTSPYKLNRVVEMIRGLKVAEAITQLNFNHKRISQDVRKALQSAVANAENNHNLNVDALYVKEAWVGKSFVMTRYHARARGRGAQILKPFSHLTIVVREKEGA